MFNFAASMHASVFGCAVFIACSAPLLAGEFVDPTRPAAYQSAGGGALKRYRLQSVLVSGERKVAIINGSSFGVGDRTGLGKITAIDKYRVVIQGERRHVLQLQSANVKKKVAGN